MPKNHDKSMFSSSERANILFSEFPPLGDITDKMREKNESRFFTGGVRINFSKYRTTEEDRRYRELSRKRKLP